MNGSHLIFFFYFDDLDTCGRRETILIIEIDRRKNKASPYCTILCNGNEREPNKFLLLGRENRSRPIIKEEEMRNKMTEIL